MSILEYEYDFECYKSCSVLSWYKTKKKSLNKRVGVVLVNLELKLRNCRLNIYRCIRILFHFSGMTNIE